MPTSSRFRILSRALATTFLLAGCASDGVITDPPHRAGDAGVGAIDGGSGDAGAGDNADGGVVLVDPDAGPLPSDGCDSDPPIFPGAEEIPDHFDNDCDGLIDELDVCATGEADYATIGAAIDAAPSGGVLAVCPGIYHERLVIDDKPLSIHGVGGAAVTILEADGGVALTVRATTGTGVRIEGFTIRGGDNAAAGGGVRCELSGLRLLSDVVRDNQANGGGGLYASGCALEVSASHFGDNAGGPRGGGAYLVGCSGEISGSTFVNNQAVNGGGLHVTGGSVALRGNQLRDNVAELRGGALYHSDALVEENAMVNNSAGWTGGGVHIVAHAPTLRLNQVRRNTSANDGGGIYIHMGEAAILDNQITDNVSGDDGGGIRVFTSRARIEGNLIMGNVSGDGGGGIRVSHQPAQIIDNVIRDNQATFGGGLDLDNDSSVVRGGVIEGNEAWRGGGISGTLFPWLGGTIEGVRIAGNRAGYGGGIYLEDNFYPVALRDLDVVENEARWGGGIFVRATDVTIRQTLIARNQGDDDGGGLYVGEPAPWGSPSLCPCPPAQPSIEVDFVVLHANAASQGSAVWVDASGLTIASSILSGHDGAAVMVTGADTPGWRYNDTTPSSFVGMADPSGTDGNISAAPMFDDTVSGFALTAGSPCIDTGDPAFLDEDSTRADMGRYAGSGAP